MPEYDLIAVLVIAFAYFLAGVAKGTVGFGLPLIATPLVGSVLPISTAIALTFAPILVANFHQAFVAARPVTVIRRFWVLIAFMLIGTSLGAQILTRVDRDTISLTVGILLIIFVSTQGFDLRPTISGAAERWLNPVVGFASGMLGGVAGMLGPPFLIFLVSLRLPRDAFVGTIGLFYLVGILPLYITLAFTGIIARDELIVSGLACLPLLAGMALGGWLRGRISQTGFQRALLVMIFLVALNLIRRGLV